MRGEYPGASLWPVEAVNNFLRPDKGSCITRGDSIFVKLRLGAVCKRCVIYRGRPAEKVMRGAPLVKNGVPICPNGQRFRGDAAKRLHRGVAKRLPARLVKLGSPQATGEARGTEAATFGSSAPKPRTSSRRRGQRCGWLAATIFATMVATSLARIGRGLGGLH